MVSKVLLISGVNSLATRRVNGAPIIIIEIRSKPPGIFLSIHLTRNPTKYPARKPGIIPVPETDKPIKTAYPGVTPIAIVTNIAAATPESEPLAPPTSLKN